MAFRYAGLRAAPRPDGGRTGWREDIRQFSLRITPPGSERSSSVRGAFRGRRSPEPVGCDELAGTVGEEHRDVALKDMRLEVVADHRGVPCSVYEYRVAGVDPTALYDPKTTDA